jgi:GNAT superfamily N-acetyltransferase
MKRGSPDLTVRAKGFDMRRNVEKGRIILESPNSETPKGKELFGTSVLFIHHKRGYWHDFKIEAKSAVLFDIKIFQEENRGQGIGSEWLEHMRGFAKLRGAKRFYAANVQTESKGFFAKRGFVRTRDSDWWVMKEF